jgi:hypothetical protein
VSVLRCQQHIDQLADHPDNAWAAAHVIEGIAELIAVSEVFAAEGHDEPDWMGRCF